MKTDKINRLVRDFLHGDMPEEIQRRFRRWMTAPADRETKDAALFEAWKELLARPAERDYRHKLPDIHHRIDMLDRAGKKSRFISLRRFAAAAALLALVVCGDTCSCVRGMNAPLRCAWSRPEAARASSRFPTGRGSGSTATVV